jgi:hypothetical protein
MPSVEVLLDLVKFILLPGCVVAAVAGWILLPRRGAGVAILMGIVAANYMGAQIPWWEVNSGFGLWLVALALSQATVLLDNTRPRYLLLSMLWIGVLAAGLGYVEQASWNVIVGLACIAMLTMLSVVSAEQVMPRWQLLALLAATGLATSLVMVHAHSARLSDICMMWLAGCTGLLLVIRRAGPLQGLAGLAAIWFPFLLWYGQQATFSEVPVWAFVALAVAPMAGKLGCLPIKQTRLRWLVTSVWITLVAVALVLAMKYETVVTM